MKSKAAKPKYHNLRIFTDGASIPNPGHSGIGVAIRDDDNTTIDEISEYIGFATNNVAEYMALIYALEYAVKHKAVNVDLFLDSMLVVQQVKGAWKIKAPILKPLLIQAKTLIKEITGKVTLTHIPRIRNAEADKLAGNAIYLRTL